MKIIIIDNYDSFTYNLYQIVAKINGFEPLVFKNDQISFLDFLKHKPDAVLISPGPGNPKNKNDFGVCLDIIKKSKIPILGICLGHQGIGFAYGAEIIETKKIMHGRKSKILHNNSVLFSGIKQGFNAVRYHSFCIKSIPSGFKKTAWTKDNIIMGIEHDSLPIFGVQFHPESIGTENGVKIIENFLFFSKNYESK